MSSPEDILIQEILNGPALAPPPGITSDLNSPDNLSNGLNIVLTLCLISTTTAIFLRLYTKRFIIHNIAYEDYASLLGWLLFVGYCVPPYLSSGYGAGRHQWDVPVKNVFVLLHNLNISEILYPPTLFLVKLSILLQYQRIFVPQRRNNKGMFIGIHVVLGSNALFYFIIFFCPILQCIPREMIWNKLITDGVCNINNNVAVTTTGFFNVISDFAILFLPLSPILKLHLPLNKKLGLAAVFGLGLFVCIISIVRLVYTFIAVTTPDQTYALYPMVISAIVEVAIGIVCGCLPVLPKFFQTVTLKKLLTLTHATSSSARSNTLLSSSPRGGDWSQTNQSSGSREPAAGKLADYFPAEGRTMDTLSPGERQRESVYGWADRLTKPLPSLPALTISGEHVFEARQAEKHIHAM
ncbi:hypothetical protein MMC11_009054, partial [Xylographa trunciseda]|nr:hypothetical protein [Xylographa trunciseda]